jgi:hypothetical protein
MLHGIVEICYEHGNEPSGSKQDGEFLDKLSDLYLLKNPPAWSYLVISDYISPKDIGRSAMK